MAHIVLLPSRSFLFISYPSHSKIYMNIRKYSIIADAWNKRNNTKCSELHKKVTFGISDRSDNKQEYICYCCFLGCSLIWPVGISIGSILRKYSRAPSWKSKIFETFVFSHLFFFFVLFTRDSSRNHHMYMWLHVATLSIFLTTSKQALYTVRPPHLVLTCLFIKWIHFAAQLVERVRTLNWGYKLYFIHWKHNALYKYYRSVAYNRIFLLSFSLILYTFFRLGCMFSSKQY